MRGTTVQTALYKLGMATCLSLCSAVSSASPQGGHLVAGQGTVTATPGSTTVTQFSQQMVMDWNSFNIAAGESVHFDQPSASATALNRIFDQNASQIFGNLTANGNVFLFNSNGFLFGETASVNVGGLVATSLAIDPSDFMSGIYHLASDAHDGGLIVNRGLLHAATGGISLISDTGVINEGKIYAQRGTVNLATAAVATLDFDGDGLLRLEVSDEVADNLESLENAVSNTGEIHANAGEVLLTGKVARDVFSNVVNNSGIITANSIVTEGGVVRLVSNGGDTYNSGTIEATSALSRGGEVQVLGDRVALTDDASIDASGRLGGGEVLVGGDFQGRNPEIANASDTWVGRHTSITADASMSGDGGKVIIWADGTTRFYGDISASGGEQSGAGGLVEVSGKQQLAFDGSVDTSASNGDPGLLLLDPDNLIIDNVLTTDDAELDGDQITFGEGGSSDFTISVGALTAITGTVILQADQDITVNSNVTGLSFSASAGEYVSFQAGENIIFQDQSITLSTAGGDIQLEADSSGTPGSAGTAEDGSGTVFVPNLVSNDGDITLLGDVDLMDFGGVGEGTVNAGAGNVFISESQDSQSITIGTGGQLTPAELGKITTTGVLTIGLATSAGDDGDFGSGSVSETVEDISILSADAFSTITSDLSLIADRDVILTDPTASTTDSFDAAGIGAGESLVLQAGRDVLFVDAANDALSTAGGRIILEADSSNSGSGAADGGGSLILGAVSSANGDIVLLGNFPTLDFMGTIDAGSGDISVSAPLDSQNISLGTGGDLDIAELAQLTTTGKIRIGGAINAAGGAEWVNNLNILSTGALEPFTDGVILQASNNIVVVDLGGSTLNFSNLQAGEALVMQAGRDITFSGSGDTLTTAGATIHLEADSTHSPSNGADDDGGLDLSNITSNDGDITLIGDENEFVLVGNIDAGSGDIAISTASDNQTLELASSNDLSQAELDRLSTTGTLTIGEAFSAGAEGDTLGVNPERVRQINLQNSLTLTDARADTLVFKTTGNNNPGFEIASGRGLTVDSILVIDADSDANGTGDANIDGRITQSSGKDTSIIAQSIFGDDGNDNEIVTTGTVNLTAAEIGIGGSESQLNISGATELNIVDTGTGNMELNLVGDGGNDIDIKSNVLDVEELNTVDTFTYTNTHSSFSLDVISASGKDLAFTATAGSISDAGGDITAGSLALSVTAADQAIGSSPNPIGDLDIDDGSFTADAANGSGGVFLSSSTAISLGQIDTGTGNLEVTSAGDITNPGALTVGGNASFIADGAISVSVGNAMNSFATGIIFDNSSGSFNDVLINDTTAIALSDITTTGTLTVTSDAGITQSGTTLDIGGDASFTADGVITLNGTGNDFVTIDVDNGSSGTVITIVDTDDINLGQVAASNDLVVTAGGLATAGDITDSGGAGAITDGIAVTGTATFNAGNNGSVILDNALNDFSSNVTVTAQGGTLTNVSLTDASAITLQALSVTGALSVIADSILASSTLSAGSLTLDSASTVTATAGAITVTGNTSVTADGAITLTNTANDFDTIDLDNSANAASIQVVDQNTIDLGTVAAGGDLVVTAGTALLAGSILSSGDHDVDGNATFNIGNNSALALTGAGNDYTNSPTFNLQAGTFSGFSFTNAGDIVIDPITTTGNLTIVSGGNVTQAGSLSVDLVTGITADGLITLTDAGNDFKGAVLLDNSGDTAAVSITDTNSIELGAIDVGGDLTVTAGTASSLGNITDSATQVVAGNAVFNAGQLSTIQLDELNDYQGSVDFNSQAAGNINGLSFRNSGDIDLLGLATTTLSLESTTGGISSNQAITATANTSVDAAGVISLTNTANNLQGSITIVDATDATLVNNNAILLATAANVSGTLDLTAAGNLSAPATTITADTLLIDAFTLSTLNTDVNNLGIDVSTISPITINDNDGFAVAASGISAFNGLITLSAGGTGDITVGGNIVNQNGILPLTLQTNNGSIIDGGGVLTNSGNIVLSAQDGIGAPGAPIQTSTTASLFLTTTASTGDIYVQKASSLSLGSSFVSTAGASTQTVSLTASDWVFDVFFNMGADDYVFTSTTGGMVVTGGSLFGASSLVLDSATGIGTSLSPVIALNVNTISISSNGSFNAGDIFIDSSGSTLGIDSITTDATVNSSQQVSVVADGINLNSDITTNDNLILQAISGTLDGGGNTLSGASVGLIAVGNIDNITLDARSIAARSSSGLIDIASVHTGSDLVIDDLTVVTGLSTVNNDISLSSQDASIDIATAIDAGATGAVSLTTTESAVSADHDIGGAAQITAGGGLTLDADGGIVGITVDLGTSGIDITTAGAGAAGDINVIITDGMTTSRVNTLVTDGGSSQDVTLAATGWNINSTLDADNDNLSLIASIGSIVRTAGTLIANDLSLIANTSGAFIGGTASTAELIHIDLTGELTASTASGAGGIFVNSPASAIAISNTGLNAGSGDIHLYSSNSITGTGSLAAENLLLDSNGDINLNTTVSRVAIEAGNGDITLDNTGDLIIGRGTRADLTFIDGINTTGDLNLTATGVIDDTANGGISADDVSISSSGGLSLDSAQHTTTSFGAIDTAGGNIVLNHQGLLTLTGLDTTGDVSINNDAAVNATSGVIAVDTLTVQSVGGATLDNAANAIGTVSVTDTGAGDVTIVGTGDLTTDLISTTGAGNISIITDGTITQQQNIGTDTGDISVTSTAGDITMLDGTITRTNDGNIDYITSGGDIAIGLLAAGLNTGVVNINAQLGVGSVLKAGTDINAPNVSANTVEITSGAIGQGLDFGFDDDIRGTVTLNYTSTAFVTSAPQGADLNIVDNGPGVFNSSGARSAGNQRGQSSGLEDVGFIDTALFSDINLFVVDGTGIGLPEDQSDISPEDRRRFRQLEQGSADDGETQ